MYSRLPSRRAFLQTLAAGAAASAVPGRLHAQTPSLTTTALTDTIHVVAGDGGNIGAVRGPDGLLLIDGGFANQTADLQHFLIEKVDARKVQILFDTHWHGDHVGSNVSLGGNGVRIIAQTETKKWLSQKVNMEAFHRTVDPLDPSGIPGEVFDQGGMLNFGNERIQYRHVPFAHTSGDVYFFFRHANILQTGDLFFNGMYPVIDYSTGGWIGGMAHALDVLVKVGNKETRIVPGHGPIGTKDDMRAAQDMLHSVASRLDGFASRGASLEEVVAAKPTADFDAHFGKGFLKPEAFLAMAYPSIAHHNKKS